MDRLFLAGSGRVENWRSTFRISVAVAIPFGDVASARFAWGLVPAPLMSGVDDWDGI